MVWTPKLCKDGLRVGEASARTRTYNHPVNSHLQTICAGLERVSSVCDISGFALIPNIDTGRYKQQLSTIFTTVLENKFASANPKPQAAPAGGSNRLPGSNHSKPAKDRHTMIELNSIKAKVQEECKHSIPSGPLLPRGWCPRSAHRASKWLSNKQTATWTDS